MPVSTVIAGDRASVSTRASPRTIEPIRMRCGTFLISCRRRGVAPASDDWGRRWFPTVDVWSAGGVSMRGSGGGMGNMGSMGGGGPVRSGGAWRDGCGNDAAAHGRWSRLFRPIRATVGFRWRGRAARRHRQRSWVTGPPMIMTKRCRCRLRLRTSTPHRAILGAG